MSYTFDGANKVCVLGAGVTTLSVGDMYSRWKEWLLEGDNTKYLPFLDVVGGNPTAGGNAIASYFFALNGWKVRPQEASHTLTVQGILNVDGGGDPFTDTVGNWRIRIVQVVPMQAETITVYAGEGSSLTKQDVRNAMTMPATTTPAQGSIDKAVENVGDLVVAFS